MKKIILCLIIFLCSCSKKSYGLLDDFKASKIPFEQGNKFAKLNLDNYDYYKREIYYQFDGLTFIKSPDQISNGKQNRRYEVQIIAIEKTGLKDRNVFYFSYIPPYRPSYKDEYAYELVPYNDFKLVNLNDINYIQFGKLNSLNEVKFIKDKSISIWTISFEKDTSSTSIDKVVFLDKGKIKIVKTSDFFLNRSNYRKIDSPNILLHYYPGEPISPECTDYLKDRFLYYDLIKNDIYFHFENYLDDKKNTWIKYSQKRIKAKYILSKS